MQKKKNESLFLFVLSREEKKKRSFSPLVSYFFFYFLCYDRAFTSPIFSSIQRQQKMHFNSAFLIKKKRKSLVTSRNVSRYVSLDFSARRICSRNARQWITYIISPYRLNYRILPTIGGARNNTLPFGLQADCSD